MNTNAIKCVLFSMQLSLLQAQTINVQNNLSTDILVQQKFLGKGVEALNIRYSGAESAVGYFEADPLATQDLGFSNGIVLSTGKVLDAKGPNTSSNKSSALFMSGDRDLENSLGGNTDTYDATILEFDFIPQTDTVKFRYFFASEEYPEFVGNKFNDAFAFFISGPGYAENTNLATFGEEHISVNINNINPYKNANFYKNNKDGKAIEFDGLTTIFVAKSKVISGKLYHIKMVIADVADMEFDSGVFLEAYSFESKSLAFFETDSLSKILYGGNCSKGNFKISFSDTVKKTTKVPLILLGSAVKGVDYSGIPDTLIFLQGEIQKQVDFITSLDTLNLEVKKLIVKMDKSFLNGIQSDSMVFEIRQFPKMFILNPNNYSVCLLQQEPFSPKIEGGSGNYTINLGQFKNIQDFINLQLENDTDEEMWVTDNCTGICIKQKIHFTVLKGLETPNLSCSFSEIDRAQFHWNTIKNATSYSYRLKDSEEWQTTKDTFIKIDNDTKTYLIELQIKAVGAMDCNESIVLKTFCMNSEVDTILIPNAFSPNGDGLNDEFKAVTKGIKNVHVSIYSQWGSLMYSGEMVDYLWKPMEITPGAYVYKIDYITYSDKPKSKTGIVNVVI